MLNYAYKNFVERYISLKYLKNESCTVPKDEMISRVNDQQKRMPDYLGFGIKFVALLFLCKSFLVQLFSSQKVFTDHTASARNSNFSSFRNLIRFHDSIFEIANVSENLVQNVPKASFIPIDSKFDFIIIGSGPGGAVAARKLQEAGFNTCIFESGRSIIYDDIIRYDFDAFLEAFTGWGNSMQLDPLIVLCILPLTVGLFVKSLKGLKQADSILLILAGSILSGPLISLITDFYFILPYRFIPFVIFVAIGIGIIFSKKTNLE